MSESLSARKKRARTKRTPPYPEDATHVKVEMVPEVWHNGCTVASDNTETFLVPIEDATGPNGALPADRCSDSDRLCEHDNATERAQKWYGPYEVLLKELVSVADGERTTVAELPELHRLD